VAYAVGFVRSAEQEFDRLEEDVQWRVHQAILELAEQPRPRGCAKVKQLKGQYRIRVGAYRVVYLIDDQAKMVKVMRIRPRSQAYRQN